MAPPILIPPAAPYLLMILSLTLYSLHTGSVVEWTNQQTTTNKMLILRYGGWNQNSGEKRRPLLSKARKTRFISNKLTGNNRRTVENDIFCAVLAEVTWQGHQSRVRELMLGTASRKGWRAWVSGHWRPLNMWVTPQVIIPPPRRGVTSRREQKSWSWIPKDSKPRITVLARIRSNLTDRVKMIRSQ
jgi:hypothetical protein